MSTENNIKTTEAEKEKVRRNLLERYLSTGKVGLIKPKSTDEAIDLIETVVDMYVDVPKNNNSNSNNNDIVEDTLDTLDTLANNSIVYDENDEDENDEDEEGELEAEDTSYTSYTSYTLTLSQMSEKLKNILADI